MSEKIQRWDAIMVKAPLGVIPSEKMCKTEDVEKLETKIAQFKVENDELTKTKNMYVNICQKHEGEISRLHIVHGVKKYENEIKQLEAELDELRCCGNCNNYEPWEETADTCKLTGYRAINGAYVCKDWQPRNQK